MTTIGRCRRQHQNQCKGPTRKGLCNRHRTVWKAAQAEWKQRHDDGHPTGQANPTGPHVFRLRTDTDDWYTDCHTCHTTAGPNTEDVARLIAHNHTTQCAGPPEPTLPIAEPSAPKPEAANKRTAWTEQENAIILAYSARGAHERLPGRTRPAVSEQRRRLGAVTRAYRAWTDADDKVLHNTSNADAARILGKTRSAVTKRRQLAGIPTPMGRARAAARLAG